MEIKNVIFDLGNVLIDFNFSSFWDQIGAEKSERFLDNAEESILLFESGKISKEKFFEELKKIYKFEMKIEKLEKIWCEVFSENIDMIEVAKKIGAYYNVFIFSNTDEIHFPFIWKKFPSLHFFKKNLMLSYELNSVKPKIEIYQNAIRQFEIVPEESIFIDDRPVNIIVAEQLGFKGIIHKDFGRTKQKLDKILNYV
ncbi:MAG: HAD family phosphatase [Candidatus Cloacimonetes bacterium]|nr:HAD family phosphatase [Candidatus Cloacimonadota bacterium]